MELDALKPEMAKARTEEKEKRLKIAVGVLAVVCVVLLVALVVVVARGQSEKESKEESREGNTHFCPEEAQLAVMAETKSSGLFDDLSDEEIVAVRDYLLGQPSLNLTPHHLATVDSNYIYLIELRQAPKDEALLHMEAGGPRPARTARVVVYRGAVTPPTVEEYLVSPADEPIQHVLERGPGKDPIPFNSRPYDVIEEHVWGPIIENATKHAFRLLNESFDGWTYHNCTTRCLTYSFAAPPLESGERDVWVWLLRDVQGFYVHPVGFEILINSAGADVSRWGVVKVFYHNVSFNSVDELMAAYDDGTLQKTFLPTPEDPVFSKLVPRGTPQPRKPLRGPRQVEPDGKRYAVSGRHVEYMGWSFDFRVRTSSGLQLFDIRFNGERIVYELSAQEATAFYSGWSPMQMMTEYMDSSWGMGTSFELIRGVDCPESATYFDVTHFKDTGRPLHYRKSVCVFELDSGVPLRRHYDNNFAGGFNFAGGVAGNVLVLRTIATPYNYDYVFDYVFYANGVLEGRVSTTGYVQATHWTSHEAPYGELIQNPAVAGSVHDHFVHYKVDLDVAGTENSYETLDVELENIANPWFPGRRRIQKVVKARQKTSEKAALYHYNFDNPKYLNFYSAERNKMGVRRGYRVQIDGVMKQMYPADLPLSNATGWLFHQMAVTKQKDSELTSSSIYNQLDPYEPAVDFRQFYADNESIVQQDLVAWVTVGLMHIPHSEDIPNTGTAANSARFFLRPNNFFDEDPSMALRDAVLITPPGDRDDRAKFHRFGVPTGPLCTPRHHPDEYTGTYGSP